MPVNYLSRLTDNERTARSNLHLGVVLAFVAGALNAGGFLAIGLYTSHMSGLVSMTADELVMGQIISALSAVLAVWSFVSGAACTAILVNYSRKRWPARLYMPSLLLEAALLLVFGLVGRRLLQHELVSLSLTAILLCFTMGLQNALITKISNAEIRTTHLTGLLTDIGIELGKVFYWNRTADTPGAYRVHANMARLRIHSWLVLSFFIGALCGAFGFKHVGFVTTVPLALALVILALANLLKPDSKSR
jgi:uncharacterized membrane protein YoaK (UPF0700 family)